ncbi:MAG: hypothetical protein D6696_16750 [Acidobacteria bacterium]|nr:MAG: hypothetical protein D6696_16750 [Acidobacteriota bacterium]
MRQPRSRQQIVFALLSLAALALVAEFLAYAGLFVVEGGFTWPGERAAERRILIETIAEERAAGTSEAEQTAAAVFSSRGVVVHPFFGVSRDPAVPDSFGRGISDQGFFVRRPSADAEPSAEPSGEPSGEPEPFTVAVFGGSLANHLAISTGKRLAAVLEGSPALAGRTVRVRSFAMGGYKQPQQLNVLAYFLALGERFDVVINVDGFNDLVLPFDNLRAEVYPFYPMTWSVLTGDLSDPERQRLVGEIAYLEARRLAHAERFSSPLLARSAVAQLAWRLADRRLAGRLAERRQALAAPGLGGRPFASHGPAITPMETAARYRQLVDFWARCSLQMDALARAFGARYVHVLQPNQYLPGSKPMGRAERQRAFDPEIHHRPIVEQGYPLLIAAGEELRRRGVAFYDLTRIFADTERPLYADVCCHLNGEGNALLAEAIGRLVARDLAAGPRPGDGGGSQPR